MSKKSFLIVAIISTLVIGYLLVKSFCTPKIGYVKSAELVEKYQGMKDAKASYKQKLESWQSNIDTLENDYKRARINYESKKPSLKPAERAERELTLQKQENSIRNYLGALEEKAKEEDLKMTQAVITQINQYIETYGKENGYTIILGTNTSGSLLYGADHIDLTQELIQKLNENYTGRKE